MLDGKVAVVSGLGPGMGRDISLALAREGADIAMAARREKRMLAVAEEVEALGRRAVCIQTDICDRSACDNFAAQAAEQLGRIDILVNNAFQDGTFTTFEDSNLDDWRKTFDVNFFGTLQLTQAVLPHLKRQGDSRVIMINSMAVQKIEELYGAYAASKGALATATKTLARELGPYGVRVNAVHPGFIWGDSVEWYINHLAEQAGVTFEEKYSEIAGETCLKYLPSSEEIVGAVVFFASPLAKPVTGQALSVNCGHWFGA
ncbi:MAG: SDR family oxidoreductase [Actinobacteria bacterium]|nr:SDR family oxidoreductase [Actinomycetota bacterium]